VRPAAWAVLVLSVSLTQDASFAAVPSSEWAFEETFDSLNPDAPSQVLVPHTDP